MNMFRLDFWSSSTCSSKFFTFMRRLDSSFMGGSNTFKFLELRKFFINNNKLSAQESESLLQNAQK